MWVYANTRGKTCTFSIMVINPIKFGRPFDVIVCVSYDNSMNKILETMSVDDIFKNYRSFDKSVVTCKRVEVQYSHNRVSHVKFKRTKKPLKKFIFINMHGADGTKIEFPSTKNNVRIELLEENGRIKARFL
jgi:hypothetical protein